MTMILLTLLSVMMVGCALVLTMAALSFIEAEREIKRMTRQRVRMAPPRPLPNRPRR